MRFSLVAQCDGLVSTEELRNAVGALQLRNGDMEWSEEQLSALFLSLDRNNSGALDFNELYDALRRYDPPDVRTNRRRGADLISLEPPKRQEPKQDGSGADARAIVSVKKVLAQHQSRVM